MKNGTYRKPDERGYFGSFGGRYMPETLVYALDELTKAYEKYTQNPEFLDEWQSYLKDYVGRPTPLYFAQNLSEKYQAKIYLKREDLNHTGAHKINSALAQALLAKRLSKKRILAETGAGQHGVATATSCALLGLDCVIYMGTEDMRRQALNVFRMKLLGAEVLGVDSGSKTLKDALNEAIRDWATHVQDTQYIIGSATGPHPFPMMVRNFQKIIGIEAKEQILQREGRLPNFLLACVGGGSNAIGLFYPFIEDEEVQLYGIEAAGKGLHTGLHAAAINGGRVGILHGTKSYLIQNQDGLITEGHSVAAGVDYPCIGPEHSYLNEIGRAVYGFATDDEVLEAFLELTQLEGIIPALESAHALAYLKKLSLKPEDIVIINLSGRGDKDVQEVAELLKKE